MNTEPTYDELAERVKALEAEVSKEKAANKTLKEREERVEAIFSASPVGICLVVERQLEWTNNTLLHMVGYEKDFLLGKNVATLYLDNEACDRTERRLFDGIKNSGAGMAKTQWVHQKGNVLNCIVWACLRDPSDPSKGQVVAVTDRLLPADDEEDVRQSEKVMELSKLARRISHDFNNLLMGIQGRTSMMLLEVDAGHPHFEHLSGIEQNIQSAAELTRKLSSFAKSMV